ncbi:hypothetical protein, variant [Aphanomyces astaci]|uniref:Uncharacterized protein n=1 Tax=Aphanomyces astaci TaxID=112090 RepID=W4FCP1_APHAT|nr:hypothetical protein, variant [Aphanomyces astaci]ETV64576.1 hypothetical protein, variant [Aphanomyces astaci]|eukprot:XP_009845932.1 hypothetical protein, variant [Aphanomyces astaci]
MYLDRRVFLKKELLHVQNRCLELGLPLTRIRRSSSAALDDVRPSAFDGTDETPPSGNTPLHYPESLTPNADGHVTPEHSGGEEGASITTSITTTQPPQYVEGYVSGISVQLPSSKATTGPLPRAEFTTQLTSALSALSRTQQKPITELHKPQQPITELKKQPQQPIKELHKPQQPIKEFKKQSQHPITEFKKQSQHPITEFKKQSQHPITELHKQPEQPITELHKQPQQPITELQKQPEQPITELHKPQQPITELHKPQRPIIELHKPQWPITQFKKPKQPISDLQKPKQPITELQKPEQPITELQKPEQPITERKTPQEPIIELQQQPIPVEDEESSRPSSVYSLNDSEVGDTISVCSEDEACPPPNKVDALKADLRQVVAQIAQAAKDKHSSVATKLMKARNQIKSELALAQDEMQLDAIKHELREVVARITEATNHGDQAGVDHWMQRRAALKLQLKAVHESLDKTQRQAKPLDVLKTELRAVVTNLQRPHLTDDEMALLMAQKTELKAVIMAKQPPRNPSDIDGLKAELRKVVSNITLASKERDDALVDKLMRRRADLKAALAKAQDSEQKRTSDHRPSRSSTAASTSLHSVADPAGSFVKKLQAAASLVGNPETPKPRTPKHQNSLSFLSHNQQPQNESFRSNSGGGGGSLSSNSLHDDTSDSSSSSFTMSEAKVAQNALHAFKTELANIQHAMEKTTNERKMKKLLEQRADMKARIAATEEQLRPHAASVPPLDLEWDLSQVKKYTQGLQHELRDIVARSDESATSPQLKARRAELKAAIHTAFDRIALLQEEATIRDIQIPILSPHMTKDELTAHIEILKKELVICRYIFIYLYKNLDFSRYHTKLKSHTKHEMLILVFS